MNLTKAKQSINNEQELRFDENESLILEYMLKQNRPYSVLNIFDNLHGKIKKSDIEKSLNSLVARD